MTDPIVEEIHKTREEYAAKFGYDVDAMFEDLRERQSKSSHKIISFAKDKRTPCDLDEKKVA